MFDRDEPTFQKELYIIVKAIDNGHPPLADICTFKVTILDINDNAPIFDLPEYKAEVSEDQPENSTVLRVVAYDFDDGENSRLSYRFSYSHPNAFEEYFRIDNNTGVVYLKKSLHNLVCIFTALLFQLLNILFTETWHKIGCYGNSE